jgi:hypothetical protein
MASGHEYKPETDKKNHKKTSNSGLNSLPSLPIGLSKKKSL